MNAAAQSASTRIRRHERGLREILRRARMT
jgi:hypothetical protein